MKKGSVLGASLLIAGCAIGAGMLGMPLTTIKAGFGPTLVSFCFAWVFMTLAALVLLEVCLRFPNETNMAEMARTYFGKLGEAITLLLMLFLMYALMTAYATVIGPLIATFLPITPLIGIMVFLTILFIGMVQGTYALDYFNRFLMAGLGLSYLALLIFGLPAVNLENLKGGDFFETIPILPILIVCFGFHNLIPSLVRYLDRDVKKLRLAILFGSLIPLSIYLLWEFIVLGLIADKSQNFKTVEELFAQIGGENIVLMVMSAFAFFAVTTSFIGNALSTHDFLLDQLHFKGYVKRALMALTVIIPPTIVAAYNPDIFLKALNFAGSFAAIVLFGLLPALMALKGYRARVIPFFGEGFAIAFLLIAGVAIMVLTL
jgi:tyrosine-specific transport protein